MSHDPTVAHETGGSGIDASKNSKHGKKGSKILGFFKRSTRTVIQTAIGTDMLETKAGTAPAKNRLGVVPKPSEEFTVRSCRVQITVS